MRTAVMGKVRGRDYRADVKLSYGFLQRRVLAFAMDYFLSAIVISIIPMLITSIITQEKAFTLDNFGAMPIGWRVAGSVIAMVMAVLYFVMYPMMKGHAGQTPGKIFAKIKVTEQSGKPLKPSNLLRRELLGSLLLEGHTGFPSAYLTHFMYLFLPGRIAGGLVLVSVGISVISVVLAVFGKSHRMLHDYVGGTVVVNVE